MNVYGEYFYGNKISDYGLEHGYVDYKTLAKAFDAVMCDFERLNAAANYDFESISGGEYYEDADGERYTYDEAQEKIEELEAQRDELEEADEPDEEAIAGIENQIDALEDTHYPEIFQYFIVTANGAEILEEAGETVYYSDSLNLYVWGVDHWGTAWDYVLTNIRCNTGRDE